MDKLLTVGAVLILLGAAGLLVGVDQIQDERRFDRLVEVDEDLRDMGVESGFEVCQYAREDVGDSQRTFTCPENPHRGGELYAGAGLLVAAVGGASVYYGRQ